MIVLFTDFGLEGPYLGQIKAVLARHAPGVAVVDLVANAPACNPRASAYLLAAYAGNPVDFFAPGTVFLCVIDPGVGSAARRPIIGLIDGYWFVGPDNGLLDIIARHGYQQPQWWEITWRPEHLSSTFHGRDLFAPVAARLASGAVPGESLPAHFLESPIKTDWPDDLHEVIYLDQFGNALTGMRAASLSKTDLLKVRGCTLHWARTFSDVAPGQAFWYANANGLVEIAVNQGRVDRQLTLNIGDAIATYNRGDS